MRLSSRRIVSGDSPDWHTNCSGHASLGTLCPRNGVVPETCGSRHGELGRKGVLKLQKRWYQLNAHHLASKNLGGVSPLPTIGHGAPCNRVTLRVVSNPVKEVVSNRFG